MAVGGKWIGSSSKRERNRTGDLVQCVRPSCRFRAPRRFMSNLKSITRRTGTVGYKMGVIHEAGKRCLKETGLDRSIVNFASSRGDGMAAARASRREGMGAQGGSAAGASGRDGLKHGGETGADVPATAVGPAARQTTAAAGCRRIVLPRCFRQAVPPGSCGAPSKPRASGA